MSTAFMSTAQAQKFGLVKQHKYRAEAVTVDGFRFDSKAEAKRYGELKLMERAGEIADLCLHRTFSLHAINPHLGIAEMIGAYEADFDYYREKEWIVEDVKGTITPLAKWKIRHFEIQYGIKVRIIR